MAKYAIILQEIEGSWKGTYVVDLDFSGIGEGGTLFSPGEYEVAQKAQNLYRDAALAAGKWPERKR